MLYRDGGLTKFEEKVNEIYQNYGIDTKSMDENDLIDVYNYYAQRPKELDVDLDKSRKFYGKFDNDIL